MKLKVLFILPVLIVNTIWWAPLAIASNPAPVGGGELDNSAKKAEIKALSEEIAKLETELAALKVGYDKAVTSYDFTKSYLDNFWQNNPACSVFDESGKLVENKKDPASFCSSSYSKASNAFDKAESDLKVIAPPYEAKKAELAAKQKQMDDLINGVLNPTGTNDQGISNYQKGGTILPDTAYQEIADCEAIMRYVNNHPKPVKDAISSRQATIAGLTVAGKSPSYTDVMGCAIKTGDVKFWMVPYFVRYILEFIIGIAGLASVAGIVYGGYFYLFAGLSDDQQKGKNAIKNSIIALVLSLSAWAIVNIVISLVTSI